MRRKRGGLLPARWETLGSPACRISIAGCWSMPAISKLRMTGAAGLTRTTERLPRDRARARSACKPALSTRMSPVRSSRNTSPGANSRTASVNRGAVEKSSSPVSPNTTPIGERRNVKAGHHGSYIPRYRSTYARSPALRVCSRVRLSACLTQTSTMPNVAASTPATRFPRRHRSDEGELELDELDRFPESSPRLRVPKFAVAITTWGTALFLVADERIYGWSTWPL